MTAPLMAVSPLLRDSLIAHLMQVPDFGESLPQREVVAIADVVLQSTDEGELRNWAATLSVPAALFADLLAAIRAVPRDTHGPLYTLSTVSSPAMSRAATEVISDATGPSSGLAASGLGTTSSTARDRRRPSIPQLSPEAEAPVEGSDDEEYALSSPTVNVVGNRYRYDRASVLGAGGFGVVYRGIDGDATARAGDARYVAIKEARVLSDPALKRNLEAEFGTLKQLSHANIVRVLDFVVEDDVARIVMEFMGGGTLHRAVRQQGYRLHERDVRRYLREALAGLAYLHGLGIIHRDIKPENMLLSSDGATTKLSDFGTSKHLTQCSTTTVNAVGTVAFMAPESLRDGKHSAGSDMWSLACSAIELATGDLPWAHLPEEKRQPQPLMFHIGMAHPPHHHPPLPAHLSSQLRSALKRCFAFKAADRTGAQTLLSEAYFVAETLPHDAETQEQYAEAKREHLANAAAISGDPDAWRSLALELPRGTTVLIGGQSINSTQATARAARAIVAAQDEEEAEECANAEDAVVDTESSPRPDKPARLEGKAEGRAEPPRMPEMRRDTKDVLPPHPRPGTKEHAPQGNPAPTPIPAMGGFGSRLDTTPSPPVISGLHGRPVGAPSPQRPINARRITPTMPRTRRPACPCGSSTREGICTAAATCRYSCEKCSHRLTTARRCQNPDCMLFRSVGRVANRPGGSPLLASPNGSSVW